MTTTPANIPGALQPSTRAGVGGLLALAVLNAAFLYFLPARAATGYAWAIRPPISAAFLGAGYLAGVVATALVVLQARRCQIRDPRSAHRARRRGRRGPAGRRVRRRR